MLFNVRNWIIESKIYVSTEKIKIHGKYILIIYVTNNLVMEHKRNSTESDCKK